MEKYKKQKLNTPQGAKNGAQKNQFNINGSSPSKKQKSKIPPQDE